MTGLRRLACSCALAIGVPALAASVASASTFFVSGGGNDLHSCTTLAEACKTIGAAVTKSEAVEGNATIEVAAGVYNEDLLLTKPADSGITINGSGAGTTEVLGVTGNPTVRVSLPSGGATLANLTVNTPSGDHEPGIDSGGLLTLDNVVIAMRDAGTADGIRSSEFGGVTMNGGGVFMESGSEGHAIFGVLTSLTINGAEVVVAAGSTAGGVANEAGPLSISNSTVRVAPSSKQGAIGAGGGPVSLSNVSVLQEGTGSNAYAIELFFTTGASLNGVHVTMGNVANTGGAVRQILGTASYQHLEVGGTWTGPAFAAEGGDMTLADSRLIASGAGTAPAVEYQGFGEAPGLLMQRSIAQAAPTATPSALVLIGANATLDSSEVLGGHSGVLFDQLGGKERRLTIAASTIDAGNPGVADGPGVPAVAVGASGAGSVAKVAIEGSILLEHQLAEDITGGRVEVGCSHSDAPSQTQAEGGGAGAISCAAGSEGNTSSTPESLFATPITNYVLNPSSSAVDSVPAGVIALPFGLTPSATDLAGNPRVVNGNGDCAAIQDKGALELQGHAGTCPPPPPPPPPTPKPTPGSITALAVSPSSFFAAPSGATATAAKRKYGTKITYRDSQAATTTFTVLRPSGGRRQGRSCKKPSRRNRRGRRCTILTKVGSFVHVDVAGANSLHFSGRLKGRKLPHGSYSLQAVARDAAGNGAAVSKGFRIK